MHGSELDAARRAWAATASTPDAFDDPRVRVVVRPDSRLGPHGWVGAVALGAA